jgi:hypothetical protein
VVNSYARELLSLTPAERQAMEATLQRVAEIQGGEKADVYELDKVSSGRVIAAKEFTLQQPGTTGVEAEQRFTQMLTDLRGVLGEERWPVLPDRYKTANCAFWNRALIPAGNAAINVEVEIDDQGTPKASWCYTGEMGRSPKGTNGVVYSNVVGHMNGTAALSAFLPDADSDQSKYAANFGGVPAPDALRQRATAWIQQLATARLGKKEKP